MNPAIRPRRPPRSRLGVVLGLVLLACGAGIGLRAQQFRAGVSLVAVDVQVLDRQGHPLPALTAENFDVTIGGRRRRVVSADCGRQTAEADSLAGPATGRLVVLAIDTRSFDVATWQRASSAARAFVAGLAPDDRIGLIAYPDGPVLSPDVSHGRVSAAVGTVTAGAQVFVTQFNLTPSEVVDIAAESVRLRSPGSAVRRTRDEAFEQGADAPTVQAVHMRECPQDPDCPARILLDANGAVQQLESRAIESLEGLDVLTRMVGEWPGRKTVVLLTRGLPISDRPGGRPDPGDVSRLLGQAVARANASVYTLFGEPNPRDVFAASRRTLGRPGSELARELRMQSSWLESFSDAAGGLLLRVDQDSDRGWQQVLRETSAYYLLGVQPEPADRDGRLHPLKVKVDRRGATVRSRSWVMVPLER